MFPDAEDELNRLERKGVLQEACSEDAMSREFIL